MDNRWVAPIERSNVRESNITGPLTAFGDLRTAELSPQFQGSFEYTVDNTDLLTNTTTAGGTVTQATAMAVCNTSTTTGSLAALQTQQHARYKAGLGGLMRFTALFTTPVAGTDQYAGVMDTFGSSAAFKNGFSVGYDGTTFGFHRFQNDALTTVAQANWDDPMDGTGASGMTLDPTKLNVFFIQFQYLGAGAIKLFIEQDSTGTPVLVHTIDYTNQNTVPSVYMPNFHFILCANNKATVSDITIKSASYAYFIEGKTTFIELHQPINSSGTQQATSVTSEVAVFTIRCKGTYQSQDNFIDTMLEGISFAIDTNAANNLAIIRLVKNATLGGSPSYSDINTANSVMDIDTAGTTVTGGKELLSFTLSGKNDSDHVALKEHQILLNNTETLTISAQSSGSATIDANILWRELF